MEIKIKNNASKFLNGIKKNLDRIVVEGGMPTKQRILNPKSNNLNEQKEVNKC